MRKTIKLGLIGLILATSAFAQTGLDIMKKVETRDDGATVINDMTMILIDKNKKKRIRSIKTYSKDFGVDTYKTMFFTSPADVKNTAFLTFDYDDGAKDDDQWLYLPALKKTKRIPSSDKSGSFMGSDFSYSDMTQRDLKDYDFKLLKEADLKGKKVWYIEAKPKNKRVINETGYTKSLLIIRQDNLLLARAIHYLKDKRKKYFDTKDMKQVNGIWVTGVMSMTTKDGRRTTHKTILKLSNFKINTDIKDSVFTTRRIEKGL